MNKNKRFISIGLLAFILFSACQQKNEVQPADQQADTMTLDSSASTPTKQVESFSTVTKGKIESEREIPVYSRIAEQIIMFAIEKTGQYVKKGELVARLSDAAYRTRL